MFRQTTGSIGLRSAKIFRARRRNFNIHSGSPCDGDILTISAVNPLRGL